MMVKQHNFKFGLVVIGLVIFSSLQGQISPDTHYCTSENGRRCPFYLSPSSLNTPFLKKGKTMILGFSSYGSDRGRPGFEYQLAYSPIKGLGLFVNSSSIRSSFSRTIQRGYYEISFPLETFSWPRYITLRYSVTNKKKNIGVGYYKDLGYGFVFDTYATVGFGKFEVDPKYTTLKSLRSSTRQRGLQSNLSWAYRSIELGISYRYSSVKFINIEGDVLQQKAESSSQNTYLSDRNIHTLSEWAASLSWNYNRCKFQLQVGKMINHEHPNFRMNNSYTSFGLFYEIGDRKEN